MRKHPYRAFISYCRYHRETTINCPFCHNQCTLQEYQDVHAKTVHGLDKLKQCIFCANFPFHSGRKSSDHVSTHILECLKNCIRLRGVKRKCSEPIERIESEDCECFRFNSFDTRRRLDNRKKFLGNDGFYDDFPCNTLSYSGSLPVFDDESGLGVEASALFHMYFSNIWTFYHVYVRRYAFQNFKKLMHPLGKGMVVSNFWCLCDGSKGPDASSLHRHMIVAVLDSEQYEKAWKKVLEGHESERFCKGQVRIEKPFHLANAICYVSTPHSKCNGLQLGDPWNGNVKGGHFFLNKPVHKHYILSLCILWEGGMEQWVNQMLAPSSVDKWNHREYYDASNNKKYRVPLSEVLKVKKCVIPFRWNMEPTSEGNLNTYWLENEITCFRENNLALPVGFEESRNRNKKWCFWIPDRIKEKNWVYNKNQVTQLNAIKRSTKNMEKKNKEQAEKIRELEKKLREETEKSREKTERIKELEERLRDCARQPSNINYFNFSKKFFTVSRDHDTI